MKQIYSLLTLLLVGCSTISTPAVVLQKQTLQLVQLDPVLFKDCQQETPPYLEDYIQLSKDEREDALVRFTLANMTYLHSCTVEKRTLIQLQRTQQTYIDQFNQAEAQRIQRLLENRKEPQ